MLRIASVVFSYYPADPRPKREAECLAEAGMSVDVFCLRNENELAEEKVNGVQVFRLPIKRRRNGMLMYFWQYGLFFSFAFLMLSLYHLRKHYHVIHIHNMPDFLVFSALIPRLTGAKIVLDLHDPMPEVFMTKYKKRASHPLIRLLKVQEKFSIRFASLVITPNIAFRDLFISRGCPIWKIKIIMNSPQENIFTPDVDLLGSSDDDKFVIMFHGTIQEHQGLDVALEAIARVRKRIPELRFEIYGDGDDFLKPCLKRVDDLKLGDIVKYHGHKSLEEIAAAIRHIDLGIVPSKVTPFTSLNLPTRIFEYLSCEKPVIAPRTKGILDYFNEGSLIFFRAGDAADLSRTILKVYENFSKYKSVLARGTALYQKYSWSSQRKLLIQLIRFGSVRSPELLF